MFKSFMLNLLPISLLVVTIIAATTLVYGPKKTPEKVTYKTQSFVTSKKSLDFKQLKQIYAFNAVIRIEYILPNGATEKNYEVNAHSFLDLNNKTKSVAKQLGDYDEYSSIKYDWIEDSVKVSSTRYNHLTKRKTPHVLVFSKDRKKRWWIMEEYIIEYSNKK